MTYTTNEIAEACGKSIRSVCGWAKKNNVKREGRFWVFDDESRAAILEYYGKTPVQEPVEASEEPNEPTEEAREAAERIAEADELAGEATAEVREVTEPADESKESVAALAETMNRLIESYKEQLAARDETIRNQNDTINRLLDELRAANESNHQLMAGYTAEKTATAAEKTADSVERMNAITPREEKKMGFAARLKFLFTGQQ